MSARRLLVRIAAAATGLWLGGAGPMAVAHAKPVKGEGEATRGARVSGTAARSKALRRARKSALKTALGEVDGADRARTKAILRAVDAWTGSYRIISEADDGAAIRVQVEVDIDVDRLAKRIAPAAAAVAGPRRTLVKRLRSSTGCGTSERLREAITRELIGRAGISEAPGGQRLQLGFRCELLGPVPHTHLLNVRAVAEAWSDTGVIARDTAHGFAELPDDAIDAAVVRALDGIVTRLGDAQAGAIVVRIEAPAASAGVRRLRRAMRKSIRGLDDVELDGIDADGAVRLRVRGSLTAKAIAGRLRSLSLPGFSVTIADTKADAVTIRMH